MFLAKFRYQESIIEKRKHNWKQKTTLFFLTNVYTPLSWLLKPNKYFPYMLGKESTCNAGDRGLIPGSGRSTGEGVGYPLQYSWASLVAQLVKYLPAMRETWF